MSQGRWPTAILVSVANCFAHWSWRLLPFDTAEPNVTGVRGVDERRHCRAGTHAVLHCADKPTVVGVFTTGGGFHFPVSASDFGAYKRIVRLNGPFGAGSQLASLSLPGFSFWK